MTQMSLLLCTIVTMVNLVSNESNLCHQDNICTITMSHSCLSLRDECALVRTVYTSVPDIYPIRDVPREG